MERQVRVNARKLEKLIYNLEPVRKLNTLNRKEHDTIMVLRDNTSLARAQIEFSLGDEDYEARQAGFLLAAKQLKTANEALLEASFYDLINVVDVSQLSSLIDWLVEQITAIRSNH